MSSPNETATKTPPSLLDLVGVKLNAFGSLFLPTTAEQEQEAVQAWHATHILQRDWVETSFLYTIMAQQRIMVAQLDQIDQLLRLAVTNSGHQSEALGAALEVTCSSLAQIVSALERGDLPSPPPPAAVVEAPAPRARGPKKAKEGEAPSKPDEKPPTNIEGGAS